MSHKNYKLDWMADVLRMAGLKVVERDGWQTRGRGDMGDVKGVLGHHTAGALTGNSPSLNLVLNGRPDLPGPLSQLFLARDGTWHVLAAGRCNHAGKGKWQGVTAGNSSFIGVEAENAGTGKDPWPVVQMDSYIRGVAALLSHLKADAVMAPGHKEYALPKGRKIDPSFDMIDFRDKVEGVMNGAIPAIDIIMPPPQTDPARSMLRKGSQGTDVRKLQKLLGVKVDGGFGPKTETAVKAFQTKHGLLADGLVGPKTWAKLEGSK
jgi:hypothetical protein